MQVLVCLTLCITLQVTASLTTTAATATSCSGPDDCGQDECCLSSVRLKGRRSLAATQTGTCTALNALGQRCYAEPRLDVNGAHIGACPCVSSLHCEGSGQRDIPLGEIGKCSSALTKG